MIIRRHTVLKLCLLPCFLVGLLLAGCAPTQEAVVSTPSDDDVLYILPDGTMEFRGRIIDKKDVVIYEDGRGGERAAVRLIMPLHPDVYRDTITVDRVDLDVPVARK